MSILDLYDKELNKGKNADQTALALFKKTRSEIISDIGRVSRFDVVIAGGGIQGATFARLAAFNGLKVLLLEVNDYASGTSGRTSKMAHGGLRYLEYFDFKQVMEGVKAREEFYRTAPHLVKSQEFNIPIFKGQLLKKLKLQLGLTFYDLFLSRKSEKHSFISADHGPKDLFGSQRKLLGFIRFFDGLMHDVRLVIENIFAARQEGAICLNYARLDTIYQHMSDVEVSWTDCVSGEKQIAKTGIVVNTAGAWAPTLGRLSASKAIPEVRFSQGTHLYFKKKWNDPALLIPLPGKGRNYFVWPHHAGTLVGTTEKEISTPGFNPIPTAEEVEELISRISSDIPNAKLNSADIFHAYAGIRTLPAANSPKSTGNQTFKISRRHIWTFSQGVLSLLGGKFTSAAWTAEEGLKILYRHSNITKPVATLKGRILPGAYNLDFEAAKFKEKCALASVPQEVSDSCLRRLGGRVKVLLDIDPTLKVIEGRVLQADLIFAVVFEQAETLEDIFSRRLDLDVELDAGLPLLGAVCSFLNEVFPGRNWSEQAAEYRKKIESVRAILPK